MAWTHVPVQLVAYARQIAIYQNYPRLDNGLQPVQDYEIDGKRYLGLKSKYEHERDELREALENPQKDHIDVLGESSDVLYYGAQLSAQQPDRYWWLEAYSFVGRQGILLPEAFPAAIAKYLLRIENDQAGDPKFYREREAIEKAIMVPCVACGVYDWYSRMNTDGYCLYCRKNAKENLRGFSV